MDFSDIAGRLGSNKGMLEDQKKSEFTNADVAETVKVGSEMIQRNLLPVLSKIKILKPFLKDYKEFSLYDFGWRFNLGTSKQWAGLCSSNDDPLALSKEGKNIFVSVDFVKHDKNWKNSMEKTIWHEMAHAVVRQLVLTNPLFKQKLHDYDAQHRLTQGHGLIWSEICAKISGSHCPVYYQDADLKPSFKPYKAECMKCGEIYYADAPSSLPQKCGKCNIHLIAESN